MQLGKSNTEKFDNFLKMANSGDPNYQLYCSYSYHYGLDCRKNEEESKKWLELSLMNGNKVALARSYYIKDEETKCKEILVDYIKKGEITKEEKWIAFHMLGFITEKEGDHDKAIEYYNISSELGNHYSIYNTASIYKNAERIEVSFQKYKEASMMGNHNAMFYMGYMFLNGEGVSKNIEEGIISLEKSCAYNNLYSLNFLGTLYNEGIHVKKDVVKSIEFYKRAADLNFVDSIYNLALAYREEGPFQDMNLSSKYFLKCLNITNSLEFLKQNLKDKRVKWKEVYHEHWSKDNDLDDKILTIFLISKFRNSSKYNTKFLVKGISLIIVKYLCHYLQKK